MKLNQLKHSDGQAIISMLKQKGKSLTIIADSCKVTKPVVSAVINNKYKGSEETKDLIYNQILSILNDRQDINNEVYDNINTVDKLLHVGINSAKFTIPEKEFLISLHKKLSNYKVNQQQN